MDKTLGFLISWMKDWRSDLAGVELDKETRLIEDLGVDSLALIELVASIEGQFGIEILDEEYRSRRTFGTLGSVSDVIALAMARRNTLA